MVKKTEKRAADWQDIKAKIHEGRRHQRARESPRHQVAEDRQHQEQVEADYDKYYTDYQPQEGELTPQREPLFDSPFVQKKTQELDIQVSSEHAETLVQLIDILASLRDFIHECDSKIRELTAFKQELERQL